MILSLARNGGPQVSRLIRVLSLEPQKTLALKLQKSRTGASVGGTAGSHLPRRPYLLDRPRAALFCSIGLSAATR
jgi:hypothetical protein